MKETLSRIGTRLLELRYRMPLTPLGLAVVVTAAWIHVHFGTGQLDLVLYAAARVALLLVGAAVMMVLAASLVLHLHLQASRGVGDLQLESGVRAQTGFSFPRFARWPMVQVRLEWAAPRDVSASLERTGGILEEVVTPHTRGQVSQVRRRFVVTDIFGLARFSVVRLDSQRVRIVPGRAIATANTLLHFAGGEGLSHPGGPAVGELHDMRRYAHGDPLRHVLWKAYARSRQLLVRTPEQAIHPTPSAMAYFVSGRGDEATASIARFFLERGLLGEGFLFAADGADRPTSDPRAAVDQVTASVHHRQNGAVGLRRFLDSPADRRGRQCVLFVPPNAGAWLERVIALSARLQGANVILALDDELRSVRRGLARRLLVGDPLPRQRGSRSVAQVSRQLSKRGLHVTVLHRPSGEIVPLAQLEALA